ncbi:TetR/AcrR family transcriptional regulator C-terminal domain-containing protein [Kribbella sandramycini]|uniref:TetR/AcrR family transcriptional regulator C-terminal domain-containing protein n=1 Tax=Kribbella sandramycini TaxID=60450 RepID=UPI00192DF1D1
MRAQVGPVRRLSSRADVVRAAVALADAEGLDAVTIGLLARRTGVSARSLYRHVSGRDELVTAMVDAVLAAPRPAPPTGGGWRALVEHEARQEWSLYRRHPWALRALATTRPPLGVGVLAAVDRYFAALDALDHQSALAAYLTVSGYVQGMAMLTAAEADATRDTGVTNPQWWSTHLAKLAGAVDSGRYPWLTTLAQSAATQPTNLDTWFDFGLARVLDGLATYTNK